MLSEEKLDEPINMGCFIDMKTTLELPDTLLRRAKATAAARGQTMTSYVKSALEAKLAGDAEAETEKPWMAYAGVFSDPEESKRMMEAIEAACGQIDPEAWR